MQLIQYLLVGCLLCMGGWQTVRAQNRSTDALSTQEILSAIDRTTSALKTLRCEFTQTKELSLLRDQMVSYGVMYYQQEGGKLHWEYTSPYRYTFILNGKQVLMRSPGQTQVVNTSDNRMFQEIARHMMNSLTGRCLTATTDFRTQIRTENGTWIAELTPIRREMQPFFTQLRLHFDPKRQLVIRVEMIEKNKDRTIIDLKNIQTDVPLDETLFTIP